LLIRRGDVCGVDGCWWSGASVRFDGPHPAAGPINAMAMPRSKPPALTHPHTPHTPAPQPAACSGIHREFSHRVKSVSLSTFTLEEVKALKEGGNEACARCVRACVYRIYF
jgi:hypothetical protein